MAPRIAYVVTEDWAFVRHRLPMARAARDAGFEVHVLTRFGDHRGAIEAEGFTPHGLSWRRSSLSPRELGASILEARRILARIEPDVLHNVAVKPAIIGSLAALGHRSRVINSIVGLGSLFLARGAKAFLMRGAIRRLLRVLSNRDHVYAVVQNPDDYAFLAEIGVEPNRIVLIPGSGVDTDVFVPTPPPDRQPLRAAYVGRMLADKGLVTLIEAQRLLRARGVEIEIVLAGEPDPDNPTSISAATLSAWGREPGVTWLGHVDDIAGLWRDADFAVLPSRREGFPKSLLEAAASARPMVAADVPGSREIVRQGDTGYLARVDDAGSFADALEKMAGDAQARHRMGLAARALVVEHFSARIIGEQILDLYRSAK